MYTNPYAVRHFLLALTIAAGDELAADIELLVEWPPWIEGAARA